MATKTRFVFLMHPKEFKHEKAATGRLTHLCLARSELQIGVEFDPHEAVQALIGDPKNFPVLLYPGAGALDLSVAATPATPGMAQFLEIARNRQLVVFLLDATWSLGRKMLRLSPSLQRLPRLMFNPATPSRYVIKQQPHPGCLSTLEATHELLGLLERAGLDSYALPNQLLDLFNRMQELQLRCAADPNRTGYRHRPYRPPSERIPTHGRSGKRRAGVFQAPAVLSIAD